MAKNSKWDLPNDWNDEFGVPGVMKDSHSYIITWSADETCGYFTTTDKGVAKWIKTCLEDPIGVGACIWSLRDKNLNELSVKSTVDVDMKRNVLIKVKVKTLEIYSGRNMVCYFSF